MNSFVKFLLLAAGIAYWICPVDLMPGVPLDDAVAFVIAVLPQLIGVRRPE